MFNFDMILSAYVEKNADTACEKSGIDVGVYSVQGRRPYQEDEYNVLILFYNE